MPSFRRAEPATPRPDAAPSVVTVFVTATVAALFGVLVAGPAGAQVAAQFEPMREVPFHSPTIFEEPTDPDPSYPLLDNVEGDWVNVAAWPVRPMTLSLDGGHLYAVNRFHNTIAHFDGSLQRVGQFRTLWAPVSIAAYISPEDGPDSDQLLVVCQLSNAVVVHDRLTGDVIDVIDVPAQPADILVLAEENLAFVTSLAKDVVVEIDLLSRQVVAEYAIPSRQPTYLSADHNGEVVVAPRWSGNNSAVERHVNEHNPQANAAGILDLADTTVANAPGLPDEDLFWLDRTNGVAVPMARAMGTLLFGHGFNPQSREFWQLNTEANNKDPLKQTEPAIQGFISQNRLTRVTLPAFGSGGVVTPTPAQITDLDLANPTGGYDRDLSVGTPYSLTFSAGGLAFLTGLLTDNVVVLGRYGGWIAEWDLPDGCMPRQVLLDSSEQYALVYCEGLNLVKLYFLSNPPTFTADLDLGFDPTPPAVREGRKLFFDASHSLNNNHSCATCHDDGRQDMLAWNLSNGEFDDKGPMVTQTLVGINRAQHFHWRGEQLRDLLDFNDAFVNLLGGTKLDETPGGEFDQFEAFVFSLEHPANPYQNPERILDDSIEPPILSPDQKANSSAIAGRDLFLPTCEGCHHLPTGTSNDVIGDGAVFKEPRPKRQWIKVAHLWDVINKGLQDDVTVNLVASGAQTYPRLGVGLAHAGNPRNIFHFLSFFFPSTDQRTSDSTNFLFQFDSGVGPAVHAKQLMNAGNSGAAQSFVNTYMIPQANQRNADLAVFGRTTISGTNRIWGWVYDRSTGQFLRDDAVAQPLSFFTTRASLGDWFVFAGQPVGMGPLFATDFDRDDFPNGLEQLTPTDGRYVVDTDGDGDWDGHEWLNSGAPFDPNVQSNDQVDPAVVGGNPAAAWTTAKVGRLSFESTELSTYQLTMVPTLGGGILPNLSFGGGATPANTHSQVITDMFPSVPYNATLVLTDQAARTQQYDFTITPRFFTDGGETVKITNLAWTLTGISIPPGSASLTATVTTTKKTTLSPAQGRVVIGKVLVNGVPVAAANLTSSPSAFCVNNTPYTPANHINPVTGPFVISQPTNGSGVTSVSFGLSGLSSGDVVTFLPEVISSIHPTNPVCPGTSSDPNLQPIGPNPATTNFPLNWSFPDTEKVYRSLAFTYP